ncbi:MAG: hypothetical protein M1829_003816 [Trizodia sp. TS-e1964]|nr:MAG: hypothetical protein M1829_003816 [Trizodia sp. TS-e1964]
MYLRRYPSSLHPPSAPTTPTSPSFPSSPSKLSSFKHLLGDPPPSPGLPSLIPRHGKTPPSFRYRYQLRVLIWMVLGAGVLYALAFSQLRLKRSSHIINYETNDGQSYEIVGEDVLPDHPSPVMVTDAHGKARWTVFIPANASFPLAPKEYQELCAHSTEMSQHVAQMKSHASHKWHFTYRHADTNFLDVHEAARQGLLPDESSRAAAGKEAGSLANLAQQQAITSPKVCDRSLTFVLESEEAGLGNTLMQLWMAYGFAKKENRAFFIEDKHWAYGKYETLFSPPPKPSCLPPPTSQILPCPSHAAHLVISAATIKNTILSDSYRDFRKADSTHQSNIFALMRDGYESLFHLITDDAKYLKERVESFSKSVTHKGGIIIGVHVRHGDRHPYEFQYAENYIPLHRYMSTARELISSAANNTGKKDLSGKRYSQILIASDDPEVYDSDEVESAQRAQERISMATKKAVDAAAGGNAKRGVDDSIGFEGGFFKDIFWSLGANGGKSAPNSVNQGRPLPASGDTLKVRELLARAYLLDLAVMGQASDAVVCGYSAAGCRILAVMMGWNKAIVRGGWHNIDGAWGWKDIEW